MVMAISLSLLFLLCACAGAGASPLNVHLVCHTHDDVGWLKTVDQYYMGANNSIQHAGVQYILDSVVLALQADPARKFIYVEIAYFERWWNEQSDATKGIVKQLVASGQLEFINGGWCMNDEATTHYVDIVDQMARGHKFLLDNFGVKPTIGWHIDPFGHSSVQASLFAEMGFNGFFFARIDYDDFNWRVKNKTLEFVWRGSPSLGKSAEMFTGVTLFGYGPPPGFCFDMSCDDPPIQNDPNLFDVNIQQRADLFSFWMQLEGSYYNGNDIMLTMGSDFQYENANEWYKNLDKVMGYINANQNKYNLNMFYSTPSQYVAAKHASNLTWTVKTDDFFPYADCPWCFWTGYFVSRPAVKGYVRDMSSYLQTCRQLEWVYSRDNVSSSYLWHAMGVAQHHDAVSGTEKQHVAYDYAKRLAIGESICGELINTAIGELSNTNGTTDTFSQCPLANETICASTAGLKAGSAGVVVEVWNPLGWTIVDTIRVPVPANVSFTVMDQFGTPMVYQVISAEVLRGESMPFVLVFQSKLPAMGLSTFFIVTPAASEDNSNSNSDANNANNASSSRGHSHSQVKGFTQSISNENLRLTFDATGRLVLIDQLSLGVSMPVSQDLMWYNASDGNNANSSQASGAYIFRPNSSTPISVNSGDIQLTALRGPVVQQVTQVFSSWAKQTMRLFAGAQHIEVEYEIGPIPTDDNLGKEIITKWWTPFFTNKTFFTDSNGREMRTRVRDFRFSWPYNKTTVVTGNYYPINSAAYINDLAKSLRFTVVTDRSQGGSSMEDGSLEVMMHRRLLHDDSRGVGEALNESGISGHGLIIRTTHKVIFNSEKQSPDIQRDTEAEVTYRRRLAFSPLATSVSTWIATHTTSISFLTADLPPQLHLETFQVMSFTQTTASVLLRLAHVYEVNESSDRSVPVTVDLSKMFILFSQVTNATELSLSANQDASSVNRYQWNTEDNASRGAVEHPRHKLDGFSVTISPMEIRTFLVTGNFA